jgi:hypothetical protein
MGYAAKVICDSVSPLGVRLTTLEVTFPRFILAEVNTHRALSKSSASSRAIPVAKRIQSAIEDPFIPEVFGKNEKGMQSNATLDELSNNMARAEWLAARDSAVASAKILAGLEVHKQYANRLLEPFLFHTAVISGTEWGNFFALRRGREAQPEFRITADLMFEAMAKSNPVPAGYGDWHRPYVRDIDELELAQVTWSDADVEDILNRISIARCARVSYLTQDGKRDPNEDLSLFGRILAPGHMAPLEHVAIPELHPAASAESNFRGWVQYRKLIPHEADFSKRPDYKAPE